MCQLNWKNPYCLNLKIQMYLKERLLLRSVVLRVFPSALVENDSHCTVMWFFYAFSLSNSTLVPYD